VPIARKILGGFTALLLALWLAVYGWARMPATPPLSDAERAAIMATLRAALEHAAAPPTDAPAAPAPFDRPLAGPLFVALFVDGAPALRLESRAPTLAAAVADAAAQLGRATQSDEARARGRLKVDVTLARAPIVAGVAPLFALSIVPGVDGIGVGVAGHDAWLTVDELMRADVLATAEPLRGMDLELGADPVAIGKLLGHALGLDEAAFDAAPKSWFRFRADAFVEPAAAKDRGHALAVTRGDVPGPPLTKESLRAGAIAGGRYLLRHLYDDGRFGYEYLPATDKDEAYGLDYSLPRHAGATYYLSQLYGATHDDSFRDGAARAIAFLAQRHPGSCDRPDRACVGNADSGSVDLGAAAMSLLAAVEYQAATGRRDYEPWARRLAGFLGYMQKPNGDFRHLYDPRRDVRDERTKMLYFSGEAAFALAKLVTLLGPGDRDYAAASGALDRALHYLTDTQYDTLAGKFYFGEDHWTCMAADAGWDALPPDHREPYASFCDDFVKFMRRTQFGPDEAVTRAQPDFLGAYGFSPFLPPHATPVGSRSETTLSTYHLQQRRGKADPRTLMQIRLGMQFLLAHQISDDDAWLMANPEAARGGLLMSDVKRFVRIDFIQHSCSAMLRAIPLL
jgi:hypothetical protein